MSRDPDRHTHGHTYYAINDIDYIYSGYRVKKITTLTINPNIPKRLIK